MKSDSQIQADVMQELKWDPSVTHERIGVSAASGVVTLAGTIPSYLEKLSAEKAAQRVAGVKAIVEKMDVKLPSSLERNDQDIASAIVHQFQWSVQIPQDLIKVSVENGWVDLSGTADWDFQRKAAEKAVRGLAGVKGVSNNIRLNIKSVEPSIVKKNIEDALKREAVNEAKQINVTVKGNTVTLSGEVHSFTEMKNAKIAAWSSPGVTKIENLLHMSQ